MVFHIGPTQPANYRKGAALPSPNFELTTFKLQPFNTTASAMAHLLNPLATPAQLHHRSSFSALPQDLQEAVFIATQCLTQAAGLLLELPQSVTAQANVILARYWLVDSPMAHEFSVMAISFTLDVRFS